jgi:hypothetical protein
MENLSFKVYVGVKKESKELAKQQGIKYDAGLKKWYIVFNYDEFISNEALKTNEFKPYSIELLGNVPNYKKYTYEISNILKQRNNINII